MQRAEDKHGMAGSPTARGANARTGVDTMVQSTSSTAPNAAAVITEVTPSQPPPENDVPPPPERESSPPVPPDDEPVPDTLRRFSTLSSRVELDNILDGLGGDEIAVLARIAKRLEMGRTTYGPLQVELDPRAFRSKEAREELEDAVVYFACSWLKMEATGVGS
jgi:hypothetical protein